MTKGIDDLIKGLEDATPAPRSKARDADLDLAMAAFDNIHRDAPRAASEKSGFLSRLMDTVLRPGFLVPGGMVAASVAALVLVVNTDEVMEQPDILASAPTEARAPTPEAAAEAPALEMVADAPMSEEAVDDGMETALVAFAFIGAPEREDTVAALGATRSLQGLARRATPLADTQESALAVVAPITLAPDSATFIGETDGAPATISLTLGGPVAYPAEIELAPAACPADVDCGANSLTVAEAGDNGQISWTEAFVCLGAARGLSAEFTLQLTDQRGIQSEPRTVTLSCLE